MVKKPTPVWGSFTKAELIRTVKTLSARETKHLNTIAKLQRVADDATALVAALDVDGTGTIWLRDVDGSGSLHPCARDDKGAVAYIRAPDLNEAAVAAAYGVLFPAPGCLQPLRDTSLVGLKTLADMAALDKALDAKGMHVPESQCVDGAMTDKPPFFGQGGDVWGDDILNDAARKMTGGKFPWEQD